MKIIIAGAGAVGTHLAKLLSDEKQDIILMDENEEKLSKLDSNFDLMTVNASTTSISGLKNAGVAGADLFRRSVKSDCNVFTGGYTENLSCIAAGRKSPPDAAGDRAGQDQAASGGTLSLFVI